MSARPIYVRSWSYNYILMSIVGTVSLDTMWAKLKCKIVSKIHFSDKRHWSHDSSCRSANNALHMFTRRAEHASHLTATTEIWERKLHAKSKIYGKYSLGSIVPKWDLGRIQHYHSTLWKHYPANKDRKCPTPNSNLSVCGSHTMCWTPPSAYSWLFDSHASLADLVMQLTIDRAHSSNDDNAQQSNRTFEEHIRSANM